MKLQQNQQVSNNPFTGTGFQLTQEVPSEAIITLNLAKDSNVEKFGGRIWTKTIGDGSFGILGKVSELSNVKYQGFQVKKEMLAGAQIEVRLSSSDKVKLLQELDKLEGRIADIHIKLTGDPTFGTLTLATGDEVPSAIFPGALCGVRQGTSNIQGDEFKSQNDFDAFCRSMSEKTKKSANDYRTQMKMARESAPADTENANILG